MFKVEGLKEKEKEFLGLGCRDYFWLVCRFVDSIFKEDVKLDFVSIISMCLSIYIICLCIFICFLFLV